MINHNHSRPYTRQCLRQKNRFSLTQSRFRLFANTIMIARKNKISWKSHPRRKKLPAFPNYCFMFFFLNFSSFHVNLNIYVLWENILSVLFKNFYLRLAWLKFNKCFFYSSYHLWIFFFFSKKYIFYWHLYKIYKLSILFYIHMLGFALSAKKT